MFSACKTLFLLVRGWLRMQFGACPGCAGRAVYTCSVCVGYDERFPGRGFPRRSWWPRFAFQLRHRR